MDNCADSNTTLSPMQEKQMSMKIPIFFTADAINVLMSLPANVYVLWLIVTGPNGAINSDFFALNLAASEILSSISSLMFIIYKLYQQADLFLSFARFLSGVVLFGRPLFHGCICVERYLAVIHPVTFLKYKPLRYRVGCSGVVWVLVIGSCFGYMLAETTLEWRGYALSFNIVLFSVMLFCCLAVLRALKLPGPGDREGDREWTNNTKLKAFRIISAIMVSMVIMYFPMVLLQISFYFIDLPAFCFGVSLCFSILITCGFVQPLLYFHRAGKLPCIKRT